jgi:GTP-binding protein Era
MNMEENSESEFRSGFVALIGKPNVGKSTLLNRLLGQPIAGVSAKPQTTRRRQLGILTAKDYQIVFVDTPGLTDAKDKLSKSINSEVQFALNDSDLLLLLVDASNPQDTMDEKLLEAIQASRTQPPALVVFNKADRLNKSSFSQLSALYREKLPNARTLQISALDGAGVKTMLQEIVSLLPLGPQYFPDEQVTEDYERDIAAEMIRAVCMDMLSEEIPYSIATQVQSYKERENGILYIEATIFVERDSQKAIVIGRKGQMIREIGTKAREELEKSTGQKVFLELVVKVQKDWKNDPFFLKQIGLSGG